MPEKIWATSKRMNSECRLVVSVPAYAEYERILDLVWSAIQQDKIKKTEFEVAIIVNNSRDEAKEKTVGFKQNQKTLAVLKACIYQRYDSKVPQGLRSKVNVIRRSGLQLVVINASSVGLAAEYHTVGLARDKAVRAVAKRFKQIGQNLGIVLSTDADCELDPLAAYHAIQAFDKNKKIVGGVGQPCCYYPDDVPFRELVPVYFELRKHLQSIYKQLKLLYTIPVPTVFNQVKLEGFCACFTVDAYLKTGGFAHLAGGEDYVLGYKLAQLGKVIAVQSVVRVPLRISHRTSKGEAMGWEVDRAVRVVSQTPISIEGPDFYIAHSKVIRALVKHLSWDRFSSTYPDVALVIPQHAYVKLLGRMLTKEGFLKQPEEYFLLKQIIISDITPGVKRLVPDQPVAEVLQITEQLVFQRFANSKTVKKEYQARLKKLVQELTDTSSAELLIYTKQAKVLDELMKG